MIQLPKSVIIPNKTIQICGSKSISNRLLILNALFQNIKIENLSDSQDTLILKNSLETKQETVNIHHAGTAMRFLASYFAILEGGSKILTGSERMKQRPIKELVEALCELGADITYLGKEGFPPLKINGKKLSKSRVKIPAHISSQFITSLMLIGAKLQHGLTIELEGEITSEPYIKMTMATLKRAGITAEFQDKIIRIGKLVYNQKISNTFYYEIESDWSSASYFYSLAAIGRTNINLKSFKPYSVQGDARLKEIYWNYFGINTVSDSQEHTISLFPEPFDFPEKIEINLNDCPDIAQTVCVTSAALQIPFSITGLQTLKIKETDRLTALQNELYKIGCETKITESSIYSERFFKPSDKINIATYQDHRMAMSFAPYCLLQEINIENPEVVEKSYPKFWEDLSKILQNKKTEIE